MGGRRRVSAKPLTKAAKDLAVNITYHRHQADMTRKDFAKKLLPRYYVASSPRKGLRNPQL
jgi:hypothetical protein